MDEVCSPRVCSLGAGLHSRLLLGMHAIGNQAVNHALCMLYSIQVTGDPSDRWHLQGTVSSLWLMAHSASNDCPRGPTDPSSRLLLGALSSLPLTRAAFKAARALTQLQDQLVGLLGGWARWLGWVVS